jgi:hypothetical protein
LTGEFDGWGFALGHVAGARSFKVRGDGTLTGVFHEREWLPGENLADCRKIVGFYIPGVGVSDSVAPVWEVNESGHHCVGWSWEVDGVHGIHTNGFPEKVYQGFEDADHDFAECKCGFYGYTRGSLDWVTRINVSGIVHAYGRVALGEVGFRAEKAKIVALYTPPVSEIKTQLSNDLGVNPNLPMQESFRRVQRRSMVPEDLFLRIAWRYPQVPMYTDLDQMLADFPVDEARREAA